MTGSPQALHWLLRAKRNPRHRFAVTVGVVALCCRVVTATGAAAGLVPEPPAIAEEFSYPVLAEGGEWCVVGVAAGVGDLVRFDGEHRLVAHHANIKLVHAALPALNWQGPQVPRA